MAETSWIRVWRLEQFCQGRRCCQGRGEEVAGRVGLNSALSAEVGARPRMHSGLCHRGASCWDLRGSPCGEWTCWLPTV